MNLSFDDDKGTRCKLSIGLTSWSLVLMMIKEQRCQLSIGLTSYLIEWISRYHWKEQREYQVKEEIKFGFWRLSEDVQRFGTGEALEQEDQSEAFCF